jgi:LPXTG-motif cell wall-anchored protein
MKKISKYSFALIFALLTIIIINPNTSLASNAPSCRLTADSGDVIVPFGMQIMSNAGTRTATVNANVPAGTYNLIAETWDNHSGHGDQNQHYERVKFTGKNSSGATVFTSTPTNDIPANTNWMVTNLNTNLVLGSAVTSITVSHNHIGTSNYQSLYPVCLKFQKVNPPTPPPPVDPELNASCSVSIANPKKGQVVTWTANPTGGSGTYTYNWTGTDNLSGTTKQINKTYSTIGTKTASVTVTSGSQSKTVNCTNITVVEDVVEPSTPQAFCTVSRTRIEAGQSVTFTANASGGKSPYTYRWTGDISGSTSSRTVTFNNPGTYRVYLEVTDANNRRDTDTCATIIVEDRYDYYNLDVECRVSDTRAREGDRITFEAIVRDGKSPYTYRWSGDVSGTNRTESVRFNREGRYTAEVTVRDSNGNSRTASCGTVRVERENDVRVITTTTQTPLPPTGNLASVNSVLLSQLPYTGPEDTAKVLGYIALLLLLSSIFGYSLLKNKNKKTISDKVKAFKENNKLNKTSGVRP